MTRDRGTPHRRHGSAAAAVMISVLLASAGTLGCGSEFDAAVGPCDLAGLELTAPPMTSVPPSPTVPPAPIVVKLAVSNAMSETNDRVILSVDEAGVAVATGRGGGGSAQLDPAAMAKLTTCFTDSAFASLDTEYPDQVSSKDTKGHFCGVSDASDYTIAVQGIAETKTVTAYALDLDLGSECDLGHPEALKQVYAGLSDLREQVATQGH